MKPKKVILQKTIDARSELSWRPLSEVLLKEVDDPLYLDMDFSGPLPELCPPGLSSGKFPAVRSIGTISHTDEDLPYGSSSLSLERFKEQLDVFSKFMRKSGVYALSSVVIPLISLILAPMLTHTLSTVEYGMYTLVNTLIGLVSGITQLGLSSAFFRAYNYDYTKQRDKLDVLATTSFILLSISILVVIGCFIFAPMLARLLFGKNSGYDLLMIAGGVIVVQNLVLPGMSWLRADSKSWFYSLLSISNMLITLVATLLLVGILHWGVRGALLAIGAGYLSVVLLTLPFILYRAGFVVRLDIARNLLSFGSPLVLSFISYWVLQLSDRYLVSRISSLSEAARYAVAYSLGSAISVVVISPFMLAWPTTMFSIAKRKNAAKMFQLVFRLQSLCLLFAAFCLSLVGVFLLKKLFPVTYHSMAPVIPIISLSLVFYGIYYVFMAGANIIRKLWLSSVFTTIAALVNFLLNIILIPHYGAMGAAVATLLAYIVLALSSYVINQRIYPVPFELGKFFLALIVGAVLYVGCSVTAQHQNDGVTLGVYISGAFVYCIMLVVIGISARLRSINVKRLMSLYGS